MRWVMKILKMLRKLLNLIGCIIEYFGLLASFLVFITKQLFKWTLLLPVFFYMKVLSPILPSVCRFTPTCSHFMVEAIKKKGPIWGLILGIYRIIRCNPFNPGGYDPVDRWPPYWDGKKWRWRLKKINEKIKPEIKTLEQDMQTNEAEASDTQVIQAENVKKRS